MTMTGCTVGLRDSINEEPVLHNDLDSRFNAREVEP